MIRKTILVVNAALALTLIAACSSNPVPTQEEIALKARNRGFTVIEGTWVESGRGHGISVEVGSCKGNFYINNDNSILLEVFSEEDGGLIVTVGDMRLDAVLRTSPTNVCAPEV